MAALSAFGSLLRSDRGAARVQYCGGLSGRCKECDASLYVVGRSCARAAKTLGRGTGEVGIRSSVCRDVDARARTLAIALGRAWHSTFDLGESLAEGKRMANSQAILAWSRYSKR